MARQLKKSKSVPWGLRRVGLGVISSSSTSELGTAISIASSESEDAFTFLKGDFGSLVGDEGLREFEGPATFPNVGSELDVRPGLLLRFLGVSWSTSWAMIAGRFTSCKTNGLLPAHEYWQVGQLEDVLTSLCSKRILSLP